MSERIDNVNNNWYSIVNTIKMPYGALLSKEEIANKNFSQNDYYEIIESLYGMINYLSEGIDSKIRKAHGASRDSIFNIPKQPGSRWWAIEGDPLFLGKVNNEDNFSLLTFKDGYYQYLCPREGSAYTTIKDIQPIDIVKRNQNDNNS